MRYVINRTIHFRNTDGALWKEDENEPSAITLTVTTSRLLTFLLEHHGEVASRDDILETVWESHGLRSSNNSLNKYIADLRKVFSNLELTGDIIITVPKIGFMFNREIEVDKEPAVDDDRFESELQQSIVSTDNKPSKTKFKLPVLVIIIGLLPIVLSSLGIGVRFSGVGSLPQSNSYILGNIDGCDVYTLQQSSVDMTGVKISIARRLMKETGIKCLENTRLFYQPSDPVVYGYPGRVFLSRCTFNKDTDEKFAACDNFYGANYANK
ncbi:winged helix-turn-helix domain-containing protein [Enterobacter ludwigii]